MHKPASLVFVLYYTMIYIHKLAIVSTK